MSPAVVPMARPPSASMMVASGRRREQLPLLEERGPGWLVGVGTGLKKPSPLAQISHAMSTMTKTTTGGSASAQPFAHGGGQRRAASLAGGGGHPKELSERARVGQVLATHRAGPGAPRAPR